DVAVNGKLTLSLLSGSLVASAINGAGYCTSYAPTPNPKPRDGFKPLVSTSLAPAAADVNTYHTYVYNGVTYSGESLGGTTLTSTTKGTSVTNPLGVCYRTTSGGTYIIGDSVTWNGTLVVEGNCSIQGTNITFNAQDNMPALVVTGWLEIIGAASRTITCNGVCYVGSQVRGNSITYTPNVT